MNKQYYFAYGMNTNLSSMAARCPAAVSLGYARLLDYDFRFATHADVKPLMNSYVDGVLWEITDSCLASLDLLEGYPYYYDRVNAQVLTEDGLVDAIIYTMQPGNPDADPAPSYFAMCLEGYSEHNVPNGQLLQAISDTKFDKKFDYVYNLALNS
jgi:gamma-glutamylcyclotransferase (GGCT)/AIG2-like uncharacterized protein YtfP